MNPRKCGFMRYHEIVAHNSLYSSMMPDIYNHDILNQKSLDFILHSPDLAL